MKPCEFFTYDFTDVSNFWLRLVQIMDLAFFVTDYCEYGPINQDLDPCSRVYEPQLKTSCA